MTAVPDELTDGHFYHALSLNDKPGQIGRTDRQTDDQAQCSTNFALVTDVKVSWKGRIATYHQVNHESLFI